MPIPRRLVRAFQLFFLFLALFAFAQPAHGGKVKGDAFLGYSRLMNDTFYPNVGGLNGWQLAGQIQWKPFLGAEGDVAHYGLAADSSIPRTTSVLFGPRVSVGAAGVKVFAHFLLGGEHSANNNDVSGGAFAYALGGGADFPIAPLFAWRVTIDRMSAPSQSPSEGAHARFATGIVFRF